MNPTTLADRMRDAINGRGCSQVDLALACGIKAASVNNWLSGSSRSLKASTAVRAAAYLGVNLLWLTEGKGPKQGNEPKSLAAAIKEETDLDAYDLIKKGLRALVIVGKDKDEVIDLIRAKAEQSKMVAAALKEIGSPGLATETPQRKTNKR